jgi:hypothetical protein
MAVVKVYTSDNYIIVEEGSYVFEYAKGYTYYTFVGSTYTIKETVGGEYKFTQAQITAGDVRKEDNSSYTEATFKTFLRQNTGFKTAAGGSAATPIGALLTKTGQTTSYRSGDDGDIEAGRATSFTVLLANNPFGNTNRFTDTLGGQTYANNIVIDWSTYDGTNVLGYKRTLRALGINWNNAIDESISLSFGGFTSGWRMCNVKEYINIHNYEINNNSPLNYSPFNIAGGIIMWTNNTPQSSTTSAFFFQNGSLSIVVKIFASSSTYLSCRTFTVTGTTLS